MGIIRLTQVRIGNEPLGSKNGGKLLDKVSNCFLVENYYSS
jgi:hypothetical protein